jgi:oxygen-dependent protoporphyrinogen oxidase
VSRRTVAVVGGGVAGLAAALEAGRAGARVVVLEAADRLGGKVRVSDVGGLPVDEGADSMLARVPYGVQLAEDAGLGPELVSPAAGSAGLWTRGRLRPLPGGTAMGIPGDLAQLARSEVLSPTGLARVPLDLALPGVGQADDISVGALVARRLGREVVDRLVDPLLGGVYAGSADRLSLHATLPQLTAPVARSRSLLLATRRAQATATPYAGPVFRGLPGGLGRLPAAVATASGAQVRLATTVRALSRTPHGWRLELGSAAHPELLEVDAVVLAVPAAPAARLLRDLAPAAAAELAGLEYASVGIVTLVLDGPAPGTGSGYLVPALEGRTTKAVTFTSRKWAHYPGDRAVVRASVGRARETAELQRTDAELVAIVRRELSAAVGPVGRLVDSRVVRWGGGLPQYAVGHLGLVARVHAAVARHPGLAVAGAAYGGVGVPAVARSGREAARQALGAEWRHDRERTDRQQA